MHHRTDDKQTSQFESSANFNWMAFIIIVFNVKQKVVFIHAREMADRYSPFLLARVKGEDWRHVLHKTFTASMCDNVVVQQKQHSQQNAMGSFNLWVDIHDRFFDWDETL